jgi:hypothetical protein
MALRLIKQVRNKDGVPVSIGDGVYRADDSTALLHKVMDDGSVSATAGCEPSHAEDLIVYGGGVFAAVSTPAPPAKKSKPKAAMVEVEVSTDPADDTNGNSELSSSLDVLDLSVINLIAALESGDHDDHLTELLAAEKAGKTRRSAVRALKERLTNTGG